VRCVQYIARRAKFQPWYAQHAHRDITKEPTVSATRLALSGPFPTSETPLVISAPLGATRAYRLPTVTPA
jgi:hypothetical protein